MERLTPNIAILAIGWIGLQPAADDSFAIQSIHKFRFTVSDVIKTLRGKLMKDSDQRALCIFPSVFEAILASIELQKIFRAKPEVPSRIGLHYGPINEASNDTLDESVVIAEQIQSFGKTNTIIISSAVYHQIKSHPQFKTIRLGSFELKGLHGFTEIFALFGFGLSLPSNIGLFGKIKATFQKVSIAFASLILLWLILMLLV